MRRNCARRRLLKDDRRRQRNARERAQARRQLRRRERVDARLHERRLGSQGGCRSASELAHYAQAAEDVEFLFPFDWQEIEGIHDRGDWDLSRHTEYSGKDLGYTDAESKESFTPMVIETSMGIDRTSLALLVNAYDEEELGDGDVRTVLRFAPAIAPVKVAVLPLSKKLGEPARELQRKLRRRFATDYDESGNIGRRYRRQDEAGTPFCVTIDFDSAEDGKATIRERDTMAQDRVPLEGVAAYLHDRIGSMGRDLR